MDYLRNLNDEQRSRFGFDKFYPISEAIRFFEIKLSNKSNQEKFNLYLNALRYSITFEHNSIQNMSIERFENNGLKYCDDMRGTTLLAELISLNSRDKELNKYCYNLQKINYLTYYSGNNNREWAYIQLKGMLPFLNRYVSFDGVSGDFECYALVQLALYLNCLQNDFLANKNIPNDLKNKPH